MVRWLLVAAALGFVLGTPSPRRSGAAMAPDSEHAGSLKAVIHINFGDIRRQEGGLRNIEAILAEVGDANADVEVVCHSDGIGLVVRDQSLHAERIRALQARGIQFVACRNTMRQKMF